MRKNNSIISIILIILIILTLVLSLISPLLAHGENLKTEKSKTIYINNTEDLIKLSQDSSIDSWSRNKTVLLESDIDLKGIEFIPIPIFSGVFDGQGNIISGLSISVEGSDQGFFRYLEEDGLIKNLSIKGNVTPTGEKSNIGGIVGNNQGRLENCNFSGFVKGKDIVGGITGWNGSSGMVINSAFDGVIYGESKVGGIAGYNSGTLLRCSNESKVNTTVEDNNALDISDITIENINVSKLVTDSIDIGGIVGMNIGIVQNSENHGEVGYPKVGYNVGGIAGRQSGYITNCSNYGNIYGRKEVAGIAGQIEPHTSTIIGETRLNELEKELNELDSAITKMINDTKGLSETMTGGLESIKADINNSKSYAQSLMAQTENIITSEIDKISTKGLEALDKLIPLGESMEKIIADMSESMEEIEEALEYISDMIKESPEIEEELKNSIDALESFIEILPDIKENLEEIYSKINEAVELLLDGEVEGVLELLKTAYENLVIVGEKLEPVLDDIDLESIYNEIKEIIESTEDMNDSMKEALDYVLGVIEDMDEIIDEFQVIFEGFNDFLRFLSEGEDFEFAKPDDQYEKTKEDLYGSINDISSSLSGFMKDINIEGNKLIDDMESINDKLFSLMNLMINIIEEISSGEVLEADLVKDVSGEDVEKNTEGKVSDSKNFGKIEGDLNVGGISGGMSIELLDPEVDLNLKGRFSYNTIFENRAIVFRCENQGDIIGNKDNVGGIVGSMDLGYIKDCIASSSVESTDGNYVGGIAGKSDAPVVSSYARGTLDGGNYIGGISGFGKEISNSYTLVEINRSKACIGAIAGNVDENSNIKENYFVSDGLRGIDGISYVDKAEPITYESLISIEDLPSIFQEFKLNFWVEDKIIDTVNFNYGDGFSPRDYPKIPSKEDHYGKWEEFDTKDLRFDTDIHAVYSPYLTILESEEKRDDVLPIVLVEGKFTDEDNLILVEDKKEGLSITEGETQLEQWNLTIPKDGEASHTIRYLSPEGKSNLELYLLVDGKWRKTKFKKDGKYLVFESRGNNIIFSVVDGRVSYTQYIILLSIVIFTIILFFYIRRARKRKVASG